MSYILTEKINMGISACNYGAKVRYNHKGWDRLTPLGRERDNFIWTPLCPEIMSGLGVSREPVRLVGGNGFDFWAGKAKMKNRRGHDVSHDVKQGMLATMQVLQNAGIEGFVFMEGSPSCGVYRTTLKNKRLGKPPGAFGALLLNEHFFLIPSTDLDSPLKWWDWRRRLQAYAWLKRQDVTSKKKVYDIWHHFKFMCQEVDRAAADEISRMIANGPKQWNKKFYINWQIAVFDLLRKPSTEKRIIGVMQKHFAHYQKHFKKVSFDLPRPTNQDNKHEIVKKLIAMEKRAVLENYDFGGTPVIYRGR